jgi:iron-sulfur cluster repair protein YtfE (RIC family)
MMARNDYKYGYDDYARGDGETSLGKLAGAAGIGVAVGVLAMIGRKVAVQAPTYFAGEWPEALAAEHKATLKLFDALQATTSEDTVKRSTLLTVMKHALGKHAMQEENAVYPAMRQAGHLGEADKLNGEHGYVKQYLYDLELMAKDSPAFLTTVAAFRRDIEAHMREEEDVLFPKLHAELGEAKNAALTKLMNKEGFKLA